MSNEPLANETTTTPLGGLRGKSLEIDVARRLRRNGYRVAGETLIGHKKVDLVAHERRLASDWIIAVEAKEWAKSLNATELQKIWHDYESLYLQGHVHEVLVVAAKGFTPAGRRYATSRPGLAIATLEDLGTASDDFASYMESLRDEFWVGQEKISEYYQRPTEAVGGRDVESILVQWIAEDDFSVIPHGRPVAILGAYGIGKSTMAGHLAAELAIEALRDASRRIPVLIRLGELAGEQTLEGLLGKHFTATNVVSGYSFKSFMDLNAEGRFAIILDGFDEMKQMLSWSEFRFNLRQLNRLHNPAARLLLLGRPTAFETDAQQLLALHGLRPSKIGTVREPDWPDYVELEMAPLNPEQMRDFLRDYLKAHEIQVPFTDLWKQVSSRHLKDIARRPVQLRMLADVLPSYTGDLAQLDVAKVYELFIDSLIDRVMQREEKKQSRLAFPFEERRAFLSSLAYWLWVSHTADTVSAEVIPDELVTPFAHGHDLETARRDLLVGCPLDRRPGERVRFPHRSFQEFLVAEQLWSRLRTGELTFLEVDALANDEVANFMGQLRTPKDAVPASRQLETRGVIHWRMLKVLFLSDPPVRLSDNQREGTDVVISPWTLLTLSAMVQEGHAPYPREAVGQLAKMVNSLTDPEVLFALFLFMSESKPNGAAIASALRRILDMGRTERVGEGLIKSKAVFAIEDAVGDGRSDTPRIGKAIHGSIVATKTGPQVMGTGKYIDVFWRSGQAVETASRIKMTRNSRVLDLRGLRGLFAQRLPAFAFLSEWLDRSSLRASVTLTDQVELPAGSTLREDVRRIQDVLAGYEKNRPQRQRRV